MVQGGDGPTLRARVPPRELVVGIAPHLLDPPFRPHGHHDAAHGVADAAERPVLHPLGHVRKSPTVPTGHGPPVDGGRARPPAKRTICRQSLKAARRCTDDGAVSERRVRLLYKTTCWTCEQPVPAGTTIWWDDDRKHATCTECFSVDVARRRRRDDPEQQRRSQPAAGRDPARQPVAPRVTLSGLRRTGPVRTPPLRSGPVTPSAMVLLGKALVCTAARRGRCRGGTPPDEHRRIGTVEGRLERNEPHGLPHTRPPPAGPSAVGPAAAALSQDLRRVWARS